MNEPKSIKELRARETAMPAPQAQAIAQAEPIPGTDMVSADDGAKALDLMLDSKVFEQVWRVATALSRSKMVPELFQGHPDDCFVACQLALRLKCDPLMVLQNTFTVGGRPGFSATFAIALANTRGRFDGSIAYETSGTGNPITIERLETQWTGGQKKRVKVKAVVPDIAVTAWAHERRTGRRLSQTVSMQMAIADGWTDNVKYSSIPERMLSYRAALALIRLHCPEVLFGLPTVEEMEDSATIQIRTIDADAMPADQSEAIRKRIASAPATQRSVEADDEPAPSAVPDTPEASAAPAPDLTPPAQPVAVDPERVVAAKPIEHPDAAPKPAPAAEPAPNAKAAFTIAMEMIASADPKSGDDFELAQDIVRSLPAGEQRTKAREALLAKFGMSKLPTEKPQPAKRGIE